mmetsp:Transcript_15171/g.22283  ORF Transcript_15171/g.22283 Transcript_15171/m.22283 type:complete len:812 (-) Transcript_15171:155-2590(-)
MSSVTSSSSYDRRRKATPKSSTPHYMMSTTSSSASVSSRHSAGSAPASTSHSRVSRIPSASTSSSRYTSSNTKRYGSGGGGSGGRRGRTTTSSESGATDQNAAVDDGPVTDFLHTVSKLGSDEWRARTMAFERLLSTLPSEDDAPLSPDANNQLIPWYKSPPILRRLATTITTLLLDPRSTVVKHTCNSLTILLTSTTDNAARYLIKDLLPTIIALHAQTVNVIKSYALQMMLDVIPHTKFKSGLPIFLEKLRKDKNRDAREACARYLRAVLVHWGPTSNQPNYLTRDVYTHIGNGLARGLTDPSQCVRAECRSGFDTLRDIHREIWEDIVHKRDGPLSKDIRLKKTLINAAVRNDAERSLASTEGGRENDEASVYSQGSQGSQLTYSTVHTRESQISYRSYASRSTAAGNRSVATAPTVLGNRSGARYRGSGGNVAGGGTPRTTARHTAKSTIDAEGGSVGGRSTGSRRRSGIVPPSHNNSVAERKGISSASPRRRGPPQSQNPFAGAINSPPTSASAALSSVRSPPRPPPRITSSQPSNIAAAHATTTPSSAQSGKMNEEIVNKAATSIQAAIRGVNVRQSILPAEMANVSITDDDDTNNSQGGDSDKKKLGKTAKEMAHRRKTIGASKSSLVMPNSSDVMSPSSVSYDDTFTSPSPHKVQQQKSRDEKMRLSRRSSMLLQKRLEEGNDLVEGSAPSADDHVKIGHQILLAHRNHIDELMETLRREMDSVGRFEILLASSQPQQSYMNGGGDGGGGGALTEEDVLEYFEAVAVCLEERSENGKRFEQTLDKISRGEDIDDDEDLLVDEI